MAKTIATITGTALAPGVSLNRRRYTRAAIAGAVAKAQERIESGGLPLTMLTHHGAEDDSTRIVGQITSMSLGEDGSARFTADIADTDHGRAIAALVDSSDGAPFLKSVSIRGAWEGKVRRVTAEEDGKPAEEGERVSIDGLDFTKAPGVGAAQIKTFAWATDGQNETSERVLITESVEGTVTVTEETAGDGTETTPAGPPDGVREAFGVLLAIPEGITEAGTPAMSKRGSGTQGSGRVWADPGYQADKKQRYDITTKGVAKAAWSYINQASKAAKYTPAQLKRIKGRIKAALGKFGVKVAAEGWTIEPAYQVTEAVAEWYGSPETAGSYCITASNGPTNVSVSGYGLDPADLAAILTGACQGATLALKALDPDMDADIDVDDVGPNSDTDGDAGESAPDDPAVTEDGPGDTSAEADTDPADAGTEEGDPAMGDQASTETGGAAPAGLSPELAALLSEAVKNGIEAGIKAATPAAPAATEAAPAAPAATEGTKEATVAETDEQKIERLVAEKLAAAGVKPPVAETEEQRVARLVEERLTAAGVKPPVEETEEQRIDRMLTERIQGLVAEGAVSVHRAGIVVEHTVPDPEHALSAKDLAAMPDDEFVDAYAGPALDQYVGSRTRVTAVHA